jgi:peptide/nickel transport system permease protein
MFLSVFVAKILMVRSYFYKRLLQFIPLLFGISILSFFLMNLAPGEPTALLLDPKVPPQELLRIKHNLGLDQPLIIQYFIWLKNILLGNWGYSYVSTKPVLLAILERVPATLLLMGSAFVLNLMITIPLGVYSALHKGKKFDQAVTVASFVLMSLPSFWLALMLILFFSLTLGLFPTSGMLSPEVMDAPFYIQFFDLLAHLFLPVMVMTLGDLAGTIRYQRAAMLEVLSKNYIRTARAKGLSEKNVLWGHAFKNSLLPMITLLGLSLPGLLGGAVIIEKIFGWPGMGQLALQSIFARDYPLIMGMVLFSSLLILLGNLLADMGYAWADPRIRFDQGTH